MRGHVASTPVQWGKHFHSSAHSQAGMWALGMRMIAPSVEHSPAGWRLSWEVIRGEQNNRDTGMRAWKWRRSCWCLSSQERSSMQSHSPEWHRSSVGWGLKPALCPAMLLVGTLTSLVGQGSCPQHGSARLPRAQVCIHV